MACRRPIRTSDQSRTPGEWVALYPCLATFRRTSRLDYAGISHFHADRMVQ
jgi:hypothetical protein